MNREQALILVDSVKKTYDLIADHFSLSRWKLWDDLVYFSPFFKNGQDILDVGCGNGRLVELLKDVDINYTGIDFSQNLIDVARCNVYPGKNNPVFEVGDLLNMNNISHNYDIIMLIAVLQHIPKPLHREAIKNIKQKLKPDGLIMMTNWNMWQFKYIKNIFKNIKRKYTKNKIFNIPTKNLSMRDLFIPYQKNAEIEGAQLRYLYAFTKRELKKLLRHNGFEIILHIHTNREKKAHFWNGHNILTIAKLKK